MNAKAEHTTIAADDARSEARRLAKARRFASFGGEIPIARGPDPPSTYLAQTSGDPLAGGRFSGEAEAQRKITGIDATAHPASGPWNQPQGLADILNGPERLGYKIDDQVPVGAPHEIKAAKRALARPRYAQDEHSEPNLAEIEEATASLARAGKPLTTRNVLLALPADEALREMRRVSAANDLRQRELVDSPEVDRIEGEQEWLREQIGRLEADDRRD